MDDLYVDIAGDRRSAEPSGTHRSDALVMTGPVLVFGGCYSNLEATRSLLDVAAALGIPVSRTICTGDVVAYCADPRETVRLIRGSGVHVVTGNCEESIGMAADDCGCGFPEGSACDRLSAAWYAYTDAQLGEGDRAWMRSLPRRLDIVLGERQLAVIHGGVDVINRFVFGSADHDLLTRQIDLSGCAGVIGGHSGIPFTRVIGGRLWHNSGAIGMPANDGTVRTWYSVLVPSEHGITVEHRALDYDHRAAAAKMRAAGLPQGYAAALETGLWPSCDVLTPEELARRGHPIEPGSVTWEHVPASEVVWPARRATRQRRKFSDPEVTANGERRASVSLKALDTLWFNTGTLCNLACHNCYIESSPRNDSLAYLNREEVRRFLEEAAALDPSPREIGFTGGEPFMNPDIIGMIGDSLEHGFDVLILTNAMKPMQRAKEPLLGLNRRFQRRLTIRVSLDSHIAARHEELRGTGTWAPTLNGLVWLARNGFDIAVAGRTKWGEPEAEIRRGYRDVLDGLGIGIDTFDPSRLVLFPEMEPSADVPEITERCWATLGKSPDSVMCASSRVVLKRKGAARPTVVACTLIPYDARFEIGQDLTSATGPVKLAHRYCASFCVLGDGSCSTRKST